MTDFCEPEKAGLLLCGSKAVVKQCLMYFLLRLSMHHGQDGMAVELRHIWGDQAGHMIEAAL